MIRYGEKRCKIQGTNKTLISSSRTTLDAFVVGPGASEHGAVPHPRRGGTGEVRAGATRHRLADQAHHRGGRGRVRGGRGADS